MLFEVYVFGSRDEVEGHDMRRHMILVFGLLLPVGLFGQTNCEEGNGPLDLAPPKTLSAQEVIQKFGAAEKVAKEARLHYTYKQDALMQTLSGKEVTGEFHEETNVSYDEKGKRREEVTFAAQPTLRGIQLTQQTWTISGYSCR